MDKKLLILFVVILSMIPIANAVITNIGGICQTLSTSGTTYNLTADLVANVASGTCLIIAAGATNSELECNGFNIKNLNAGSGSVAIGLSSDYNFTIQNCNITGSSTGNWFNEISATSVSSAYGHKIINNTFSGALDSVIKVSSYDQDLVIDNNICSGKFRRCIEVTTGRNINITNIVMIGNFSVGITINSNETIIANNYIRKDTNRTDSGTSIGISVTQGKNRLVTNNSITMFNQFLDMKGIKYGFSTGDTYSNNYINNTPSGFSMDGGNVLTNNVISGNTLDNIGNKAVLVAGTNIQFVNNNFIASSLNPENDIKAGIFISGAASDKINITNNNFTGFKVVNGFSGAVFNNFPITNLTFNNNLVIDSKLLLMSCCGNFGTADRDYSIKNNIGQNITLAGFFSSADSIIMTNNFVNLTGTDTLGSFSCCIGNYFSTSLNSIVANNTFLTDQDSGTGIAIDAVSSGITISNNIVKGFDTGVSVDDSNNVLIEDTFINGTLFVGPSITLSNSTGILIDNLTVTNMDLLSFQASLADFNITNSHFIGGSGAVLALTESTANVYTSVFDNVATDQQYIYQMSYAPIRLEGQDFNLVYAAGTGSNPIPIGVDNVFVPGVDGTQNISLLLFSDAFIGGGVNLTFYVAGFPSNFNCTDLLMILPSPLSCSGVFPDIGIAQGSGNPYDFTPLENTFNASFGLVPGVTDPPFLNPHLSDSAIFSDGTSNLYFDYTNLVMNTNATLILPWLPQHVAQFTQASLFGVPFLINTTGSSLEFSTIDSSIFIFGGGWEIDTTPGRSVYVDYAITSIDVGLNPFLGGGASITLRNITCSAFDLFKSNDFETSLNDLLLFGTFIADETDIGSNCPNASMCTNIQCSGDVLTFDVNSFSSYGGGPNLPPTQDDPILNSTFATNRPDENLTVYPINLSDPNGDNITLITSWYINTVENTTFANLTTINSTFLSSGQLWQACIIPFDGIFFGLEKCSNTLLISTNNPQLSNITFVPTLLFPDVDLQATITYTNELGFNANVTFNWTVNAIPVRTQTYPGYYLTTTISDTLDEFNYATNDVIILTVTAVAEDNLTVSRTDGIDVQDRSVLGGAVTLPILIFFLVVALGFLFLPKIVDRFTDNEFSDFILKRGSILIGIFLMMMCAIVVMELADGAGLQFHGFLNVLIVIFQVLGYSILFWLLLGTVFRAFDLYKVKKKKKRMGDFYDG